MRWVLLIALLSGCQLYEPVLCATCVDSCPSGLSCVAGQCVTAGIRCGITEPTDAGTSTIVKPMCTPDPQACPDMAPAKVVKLACPQPRLTWTRLSSATAQLPVRFGAAAAVFPAGNSELLAVHGGFRTETIGMEQLQEILEDFWLFDLTAGTWQEVSVAGTLGARAFHSMVPVYGDAGLLLFGGAETTAVPTGVSSVQYRYLHDTRRWSQENLCGREGFSDYFRGFSLARSACGHVYLFGGSDQARSTTPSPLFRVEPAVKTVRTTSVAQRGDLRFSDTAMAFDETRQALFVIGGELLDAQNGPQTMPVFLQLKYDIRTGRWSELTTTVTPGDRAFAVGMWWPLIDRVVMFGGQLDPAAFSRELWLLAPDGPSWSLVNPFGAWPDARAGATLSRTTDGRSLILFGGADDARDYNDVWRLDADCL